jgi:long-subunit acyl-CoA synthetase (AMP-forming)
MEQARADRRTFGELLAAQLAAAIQLVASGLNERGFSKGDVFAIYSPNLPEYIIAFHAVSLLVELSQT